eukprot:1098625-Heterocapsa_arctica.AAC.1
MDHGGAGFAVQVPAGALDGAVAVPWRADPLAGACAWVWNELADLAPPEFPFPAEVAVPVELQLGLRVAEALGRLAPLVPTSSVVSFVTTSTVAVVVLVPLLPLAGLIVFLDQCRPP